jgi:hypothetical protein
VAASHWTSIEVATLAVQALTPVAVVGLGLFVARVSRRVEGVQEANRTVIARRVEIFSQVGPQLNRLLCFATFVGTWKETTPVDALRLKRGLDELMYSNRLLFSDNLFKAYRDFMASLFVMYATVEGDALLRTPVASVWGNRRNLDWWQTELASAFAQDNDACTSEQIQATYDKLTSAFRSDLYVITQGSPVIRA